MKQRTSKLLSTLLMLSMVLALLSGTAWAVEVASGTCGDNLTWTLTDDGILTISGTGSMDNYVNNEGRLSSPWYSYITQIYTVRIGDGVTTIGELAFLGCNSLIRVTIGDSVTSIGKNAFANCRSLTSVTIPDSVTTIEFGTFQRCTSLTIVTIPDSVTSIEAGAFLSCNSLTDVYYGGSESQWKQVAIDNLDGWNDPLLNATIHISTATVPNLSYKPTISSNINDQNYTDWPSSTINSNLYTNEHGGVTRVEHIPATQEWGYHNGEWGWAVSSEECLVIEDYNSNFELQNSQSIPMELDIWGGFFAGEAYNFFVFGQNNSEKDATKEVIRIVKYSKDWQRLGQASLYGACTTDPFDFGTLRATEYNGILYIRTCHGMFIDHQANMTIVVRESDMTVTNSSDLDDYGGSSAAGYVSHSFSQFIIADQERRIIALDHGDMYPRGITLFISSVKAGQEKLNGSAEEIKIQDCPENIEMYQRTGASAGGLAETTNGYVVAYNYDGKGQSDTAADRSVYFAYVNKNSLNVKTKAISSAGATTPVLVPTSLKGGYILWNASDANGNGTDTLYYAAYSDGGNIGEIKTATASLSDCQPIVYNGKVIWYTTGSLTPTENWWDPSISTVPTFYQLDENGVTAIKVKDVFTVSVETDDLGGGTVSGGDKYIEGSSAQVIATPFENYVFSGWYENGTLVSDDATYSFLVQNDRHLIAKFSLAFTDVAKGDYYYNAVLWAVTNGITVGMSDTKFGPDSTVTRAQAVSFLYRAFGNNEIVSDGTKFSDVPYDAWYANSVAWAVDRAITVGRTNGTFGPDAPVTYVQMLTFLARANGEVISGNTWETQAITWANNNDAVGVIGSYKAQDPCPRRDVVYIMHRTAE